MRVDERADRFDDQAGQPPRVGHEGGVDAKLHSLTLFRAARCNLLDGRG